MVDFVEKFNSVFEELLQDLQQTFPDDSDFNMYSIGLKAAIYTDPTIAQTTFREKVSVPYGDKIIAKDETFFLENQFTEYTTEFEEASSIIAKLKQCWGALTQENKDVVWKYLRVLVMLDRKI